jgi:AcrR family transcriptional regulator
MAARKVVGTREPRQERSRETVRAILEAAERVIAESGPANLKMGHLATVAGVAVGTLYQYFPTRDAVMRALEERSWHAQITGFQELSQELAGLPPHDAIMRIVRYAMDSMGARGELHGMTASDPATIAARLQIIDEIAELALARLKAKGTVVRPQNIALALRLAIKTIACLAWLGQRDHGEAMETGEMQREVGIMIARYLLPDDANAAAVG